MTKDILAKIEKLSTDYDRKPASANKENILYAINYLMFVVKNSDPKLILPTKIKNLNAWITAAQNNINNENTVLSNLDAALTHFPVPLTRKRSKAESVKIIDEIREKAELAINSIGDRESSIATLISEKQIELAAVEKELGNIRARIDTEAKRIDEFVSTEQKGFSDKKTELDDQARDLRETLSSSFSSLQESLKAKTEEFMSALNAETADQKRESEGDVEKIKELLNFASNASLTEDYLRMSGDEKKASFWWTIVAFVMLATAAGNALLVKAPAPDSVTWQWLILRISMVFAFVLPGLYAASKAASHRSAHLSSRRTGIRLLTLDPFLQNFEKAERDKIKSELTDEFFKEKITSKQRQPIFGFGPKTVTEIVQTVLKEK